MTKRPKRIQRRRTAGWRVPDGAVYVGRPSAWANPHVLAPNSTDDDRRRVVAQFAEEAEERHAADPDWLAPLRGRDLMCWCPLSAPCHADVLLRLANPDDGTE